MLKLLSAVLALLLCSCGMITETPQTTDPAASYAAAKVIRTKGGTLFVLGDDGLVYHSSTIAVPTSVSCGLCAGIPKGGAADYSSYVFVSKYEVKPSAFSRSPDDYKTKSVRLPFTRAALDAAARGTGLTVPLPQWHTRQTFSAAYVQGFLQKVDETLRNPAAARVSEPE
jgi:hypothetical protein